MTRMKREGRTWLDVRGASEYLKLSPHYIRMLVRFGKLAAIRLNNQYWIALEDLAAEKAARQTAVPVVPKVRPPRKRGGQAT